MICLSCGFFGYEDWFLPDNYTVSDATEKVYRCPKCNSQDVTDVIEVVALELTDSIDISALVYGAKFLIAETDDIVEKQIDIFTVRFIKQDDGTYKVSEIWLTEQ